LQEYLKNLWTLILSKIPAPLRNFYALTFAVLVLWMLFLDVDRLPRQIKKYWGNRELKEEVKYYHDKIEKGNQELKGLKTDKEKLERFAREKYYMHKDSEDVFVIDHLEETE
jgi:cell division protein DivIC